MFQKILVPLDGSPLAETILNHVQALAPVSATDGSTELALVTVLETYRYGLAADDMTAINTIDYVRESMESYLARKQEELTNMGYTVESYLIEGDAAQGILEVAESSNADLIAMTTHGRSGVARWALGSVAERVLHYAARPVLLTREDTPVVKAQDIETILVPLDGSETAAQVLDAASVVAQSTGARLQLVRVAPQFTDGERLLLFGDEVSAEKSLEKWQKQTHSGLGKTAQQLLDQGLTVETRLVAGDPATAISIVTEEVEADLVAMSTHGRLGFDRLLHGSVANSVLRQVDTPLLLVHVAE